MEKPFELIDHTADIGIIAYGKDIQQLFNNAALGMFNLIIKPDNITEHSEHEIGLNSIDKEHLLIEWLNELLFIFDTKHLVFKRCIFDTLTETQLIARYFGSKVNPKSRAIKREVKAATYHMMAINQVNNIYQVRIIFDI